MNKLHGIILSFFRRQRAACEGGDCYTAKHSMLNEYCKPCYEWYIKLYPQGWQEWAGDTCRHGVYLRPDGLQSDDCLCWKCEAGD